LRYSKPVKKLHRDIGAGARRFVVRTLHIDHVLALLDPEMSTFRG
jgi:hypothetical protein